MMQAERKKVEPLVKMARGQTDAVLKMIEDDRYCMEIANQLSAAESLLRKARREVLRAHLEGCVREALECGSEEDRTRKLDEILSLMDKSEK